MIEGLVEYKKIPFLVKSSSRFFLKPDIGEILDAIDWRDKYESIKAIHAARLRNITRYRW